MPDGVQKQRGDVKPDVIRIRGASDLVNTTIRVAEFSKEGFLPKDVARLLRDAAKWIADNEVDVDDIAFGLQDEMGYYWLSVYWNDDKNTGGT